MIKVEIKQELIEKARKKAEEMGEIRNSIREGEGNLIGFLGELLFVNRFGGRIENTYDYDVIFGDKKFDIKTKETSVEPMGNYFCSVAAYNTKQKCDYYYFVRIKSDFSVGWLLGGMSKEEFFKEATFYKEGDLDPSSSLGWKFKADCYNLAISDLG